MVTKGHNSWFTVFIDEPMFFAFVQVPSVAEATAEGIRKIADAIQTQGGAEAVSLRVAEQYVMYFHRCHNKNQK